MFLAKFKTCIQLTCSRNENHPVYFSLYRHIKQLNGPEHDVANVTIRSQVFTTRYRLSTPPCSGPQTSTINNIFESLITAKERAAYSLRTYSVPNTILSTRNTMVHKNRHHYWPHGIILQDNLKKCKITRTFLWGLAVWKPFQLSVVKRFH